MYDIFKDYLESRNNIEISSQNTITPQNVLEPGSNWGMVGGLEYALKGVKKVLTEKGINELPKGTIITTYFGLQGEVNPDNNSIVVQLKKHKLTKAVEVSELEVLNWTLNQSIVGSARDVQKVYGLQDAIPQIKITIPNT